jgi:hypothetical protein
MLPRFLSRGWGDTVGKVRLRYFVRKESGFCYWRPTRRMRSLGFRLVPLGKDGPAAWAMAEEWNKKWDAVRLGEAPPLIDLSKLSRDEAEAVRRYPAGSIGAAFQSYIRTPEWEARPLRPKQSLVASLVSHSRHVGRHRTRHNHFRDDVAMACIHGKETWSWGCPQDHQNLASALDYYARDEGRTRRRSLKGRPQPCPCSPPSAVDRR